MNLFMSEDSITAKELKATLFGVLDEVARTGHRVVVTLHGAPIADIVPHALPEKVDLAATARQLVSDDELLAPFAPDVAVW
jgi:prevent-host-death family protein